MRRRVQGIVGLRCVVGADGSVAERTVTRPLDAELDQEAVAVAKRWLFKPGTRDDAIRLRWMISLEMSFTLRA